MRYDDLPFVPQKDLRAVLQAMIDAKLEGRPLVRLILKEMDERRGLAEGTGETDCAYFLLDLMTEWGAVFEFLRFRFFINDQIAKAVGIKVPKQAKRPEQAR